MFLGIEIGGTKLQLGVGDGKSAKFAQLERADIDASRGAPAILAQIESIGLGLVQKHAIERVGIGFGGPVDPIRGRTIKSHQVSGWEDFPIVDWVSRALGKPVQLGNDCDVAAVAEAKFGAGQGAGSVFYITVGTGVGGGFVVGGKSHGQGRPAVAEIGHLRPGLYDDLPDRTVESVCSGWGIVAAAQEYITGDILRANSASLRVGKFGRATRAAESEDERQATDEFVNDLLSRCGKNPEKLTGKMVAEAARDGNELARDAVGKSTTVLGWAIAQMITLLAPEVVVIGGGVSLMGEELFFAPVRRSVTTYVFPPLAGSYRIVPAALGELAVVHGAVAIAAG